MVIADTISKLKEFVAGTLAEALCCNICDNSYKYGPYIKRPF